jgi:hypothetical protein
VCFGTPKFYGFFAVNFPDFLVNTELIIIIIICIQFFANWVYVSCKSLRRRTSSPLNPMNGTRMWSCWVFAVYVKGTEFGVHITHKLSVVDVMHGVVGYSSAHLFFPYLF